ncbi:Sulfurtransferase TusA [Micromonospora sp. MW-13]|uniref:sulfurtransferase TusA family protein n=1 Tax=unclassified Micromonospora TaxID=2617518 RepID=UPI000EB87ED4|nr:MULTISPECIES: sulfurtransferase TusA family protein [unclassified Micromonospora]MCX4470912.1 sulfurtransferase TusA family protein [Micromonospora sp. NBC_01655]RGC68042.1 Sulfurtransferase TusA [Micromonospora sp. MW-13]
MTGPDEVTRPAAPTAPAEVLDCRGQRCPLPVIGLARRLPELPVGAVLRVLADDPAAAVDIPAWCRMRGQEFVAAHSEGPGYEVRRTH